MVGVRPAYLVPRSKNRIDGWLAELGKAGRLPIDPDSEIERVSVVVDLDEHYLHRKLDERMYWLLDESAAVRLGAADGFRERALRRIIDPVSDALAPLIRNWMPGGLCWTRPWPKRGGTSWSRACRVRSDAGRKSTAQFPTCGAPRFCARFDQHGDLRSQVVKARQLRTW